MRRLPPRLRCCALNACREVFARTFSAQCVAATSAKSVLLTTRHVDEDTLNRVGILLNFAAGFLLSPGLLGVDRIRRVEAALERWSQLVADWTRLVALAPILYLASGGLTYYKVVSVVALAGIIWLWTMTTYSFVMSVALTVAGFVALIAAVAAPLLLLAPLILVLLAIERCVEAVLKRLAGDDRLLAALTIAGIVAFSVGNALQFAATFHPGRHP
jgi:hypothetical protein